MTENMRERWNRLAREASEAVAIEYQIVRSQDGLTYSKRVGNEWEPITEDEARAAGVWRDPRGDQYGVTDDIATGEQVRARDKGHYDPRKASGALVARRVKLRCGRCGSTLGHVDEHEHRTLWHSERTGRWSRRPSGIKCRECFEPLEEFRIEIPLVDAAIARARLTNAIVQLKIGA